MYKKLRRTKCYVHKHDLRKRSLLRKKYPLTLGTKVVIVDYGRVLAIVPAMKAKQGRRMPNNHPCKIHASITIFMECLHIYTCAYKLEDDWVM
jgi:hypothetical protein